MSVELQINNSATEKYVGWTPAPCRMRQVGGTADLNVNLSNGGTVGRVLFYGTSPAVGSGTATLRLTLPGNGDWVSFWLGGLWPLASISNGDAAVSVEDAANPGTAIANVTLMVRVRKNANGLTPAERNRYLAALGRLNNAGRGLFQTFRDMHTAAALDEAHGFAAFLPWHRAYILDLERQLQRIDPTVTLPYWAFDRAAPNVFLPDFMGGPPTAPSQMATFSATNPLRFWQTDGVPGVLRVPTFDTTRDAANRVRRNEATTLALSTSFGPLEEPMEVDPHGMAHVSFVPSWMRNPAVSPKDPLFFLLHCNVDRLWAKWQWINRRFDSSTPESFETGARTDRIGHHLDDTMWPWNGVTTSPRPPTAPGGGLASSPSVTAPGTQPMVRSLFDYQGRVTQGAQLGFDYDDVPYF